MHKRIAIIGAGIVGSTAAYYLSKAGYPVDLYDEGIGQASRAAAGIICPWFSLRRNKAWYFLVSQGAEFYPKLMTDLESDGQQSQAIYHQAGAILIRRKQSRIEDDLKKAVHKRQQSPLIGQVYALSPAEIEARVPWLHSGYGGIWVEGGARVHVVRLFGRKLNLLPDLIHRSRFKFKLEKSKLMTACYSVQVLG